MTARRLLYAPFTLVALAATVVGCAAEPAPTEAPRPSQATEAVEAPEPAEEPTTQPAATTIPETCEQLLPLATVQTYDPRLEAHPGVDAETQLSGMIGPKTMGTLQAGERQLYCNWGTTGTGALSYLGAAIINDSAKAELVAALRDSVYEEVPADGAEAQFTQGQSYEHQHTDRIILDGDLLIAVSHTITGDFAQDAWARIRR
ncbi:hypothetical protein [Leucobacter luti]|uniref:hypothetical protein n=1 Tax=Leucobacter luti TaxID=340320 RepID=UPI001C6924CD|nr:hypothetical protein [Leucobacter luti]QYM75598.1 hypothetical protein K1X41_13405 [Leucobacter luti]